MEDSFSPKRPSAINDLEVSRHEDGEDEIAEMDPEGRYYRYTELVGKGRFKQIFKAFDTQIGIDVAWSKLNADAHHLSEDQLRSVMAEMQQGIDLEHPNIIRCFKCWEDEQQHCINLITELFTSGNLRQYRNLHKHLDLKAVKRMARQILQGLKYLHGEGVTHGDLRCDKIYVNGHSGEIKVGDLGLQTLLPKRWEAGDVGHMHASSMADDVFAFGLCMLELFTLKQLDAQHCQEWPQYLSDIPDEEAQAFVAKCLGDEAQRPSAEQLLEDPFLQPKRPPPPAEPKPDESGLAEQEGGALAGRDKRRTDEAEGDNQPIAIGKLRGEDYLFEFQVGRRAGAAARCGCRALQGAAGLRAQGRWRWCPRGRLQPARRSWLRAASAAAARPRAGPAAAQLLRRLTAAAAAAAAAPAPAGQGQGGQDALPAGHDARGRRQRRDGRAGPGRLPHPRLCLRPRCGHRRQPGQRDRCAARAAAAARAPGLPRCCFCRAPRGRPAPRAGSAPRLPAAPAELLQLSSRPARAALPAQARSSP
jgi:WNK lysine deficient protein kinase